MPVFEAVASKFVILADQIADTILAINYNLNLLSINLLICHLLLALLGEDNLLLIGCQVLIVLQLQAGIKPILLIESSLTCWRWAR